MNGGMDERVKSRRAMISYLKVPTCNARALDKVGKQVAREGAIAIPTLN